MVIGKVSPKELSKPHRSQGPSELFRHSSMQQDSIGGIPKSNKNLTHNIYMKLRPEGQKTDEIKTSQTQGLNRRNARLTKSIYLNKVTHTPVRGLPYIGIMHEREEKPFKTKKRSSVDLVRADDSIRIQREGAQSNIRQFEKSANQKPVKAHRQSCFSGAVKAIDVDDGAKLRLKRNESDLQSE